MYDQYFSGPRPYNKIVYKALFGDEILKGSHLFEKVNKNDGKLKVD